MIKQRAVIPTLFVIFILLITLTCSNQSELEKQNLIFEYPNILDFKNVPTKTDDYPAFCFSDKGAWFGFSLPPDTAHSLYGGFTGPYLSTQGKWLSRCLAKFNIFLKNKGNETELNLADSKKSGINFFPGLLRQVFDSNGLKIKLELWYFSDQTAIIRAAITNHSTKVLSFRVDWQGSIFDGMGKLHYLEESIEIELQNDERIVIRPLANSQFTNQYHAEKNSYTIKKQPMTISPGTTIQTYLLISHFKDSERLVEDKLFLRDNLHQPDVNYQKNIDRWNGYLTNRLNIDSKWAKQKAYRRIAVKSLVTLISNWKSAHRHLFRDGLFPSNAVPYFNGFWAWDSWKHAVALTHFVPELAKDQIYAMFDYQDESGMVADCIYSDSTKNNWRNSKPPLSGWAVWNVFEATRDTLFLAEIYPKIKTYHQWWYEFRDHDQNGLCEYGCTDGTITAAKWESGMDNAVRFDNAGMVQNSKAAWSLTQESVDLNSYLYAEKIFLSKMAGILSLPKESQQFLDQANKLKSLIREYMFDSKTGYFYDIDLHSKKHIRIMGIEGWIPLWAQVATDEQASKINLILNDGEKFATYVPFPTLAKDHPEFSEDYWHGPVWLDQAYFAIKGMKNYGFNGSADKFTKQLFNRLQGLKTTGEPIYENYAPLTGEGKNAPHFSWSAAHLLLLFWDR